MFLYLPFAFDFCLRYSMYSEDLSSGKIHYTTLGNDIVTIQKTNYYKIENDGDDETDTCI